MSFYVDTGQDDEAAPAAKSAFNLDAAAHTIKQSLDRARLAVILTEDLPQQMGLEGARFWVGRWGKSSLPEGMAAAFQVALRVEGVTRGLWEVGKPMKRDEFSPEEQRILARLAEEAEQALAFILALEGTRAELEESRISRDSLQQLQRRLLHTREEERARLARDLHDGPIQTLAGINLQLGLLLAPGQEDGEETHCLPPVVEENLRSIRGEVRKLLGELRAVMAELRPPMLDTLGLGAALRALTDEWSLQQGIPVHLELPGTTLRPLPGEVSVNLYRLVQEALSNIARHARASQVKIRLNWEAAHLTLEIEDNGQGFSVPVNLNDLAAQGHFGLMGMQERVHLVGGAWSLQSVPGQGTRIVVHWDMKYPPSPFLG
ncbi:MAG TPA: sensor histidine kinase [Anaerolineaceae bacterium]